MLRFSENSVNLSRLALQAVGDPSSWQMFVHEFGKVFRATANFLTLHANRSPVPQTRLCYTDGLSEKDLYEWQSVWFAEDPWMRGKDLNQFPVGVVVPTERLCSEEELMNSQVYKVFMTPRRIHHGGGVNYLLGPESSAIHTMVRPKEEGPLRPEEIELWHSIVPAVQTSVHLSVEVRRLENENRIMEAGFQASGTGIAFLNSTGRVLRSNIAAQELIDSSPHLRMKEGILSVKDKLLQKQFLHILEEFARPVGYFATDNPWKKVMVCREGLGNEKSLLILLTRICPAKVPLLGPETPVMLAHLVDPFRPCPINVSVLSELFDLTPSEIRFAELLSTGRSVAEVCDELQITDNTGRTHLKRIFAKTGVQRQGELIGLLLRLCMRSATPDPSVNPDKSSQDNSDEPLN